LNKRDKQLIRKLENGEDLSSDERERAYFVVGTRLGRYTNVKASLKTKGDKWFLDTGQSFDISKFLKDLFG